ncbi:hypothetical protein ACG7HM_000532 [Enterococcus hirae]|uniref:Rad50/SbcC-type AAA domain-containing protein n=2 Tax=Enterococcus hirae TaxID=1354 RepID=A0AB37I7A9_ENTHR|nr:hypothetical protein [Enterococcus hirae]EMF0151802.1 hypothetical protein [Enterococcus hirae]EMF0420856.1 hypothetical protein [Enterococcus hirae]EMF0425386.1 hypothetical protein [Enterococcus hirae]EMF0513867.1 hypothetical protein [Enterococcus hirae]EMF0532481.1 hypothetical protein [Enterococcus hirae]
MNIKRLSIEITTNEDPFFFEHKFQNGLNIIASDVNTSGKSSVLSAIMYGLGMEEIIGGRGSKVLSAAFNNKIKDTNDKIYNVLKASVYLEISNQNETVTILRTVKDLPRNDNLVTVIFGNYEDRYNPKVKTIDYFVHDANSAKGRLGFFRFLEDFLGLTLPNVLGYDGKEKKLYIQNIFAAIMIEQKRGWSDILSRVPNFGIKDSKKKTIEYILKMDSIELSKTKAEIQENLKKKKEEWKDYYIEIKAYLRSLNLELLGITSEIDLIKEERLGIFSKENSMNIDEVLVDQKNKLDIISQSRYEKKYDNQSLNEELLSTMDEISKLKIKSQDFINQKNKEETEITKLLEGLENLENDIQNNKDINKIVKYGSEKNSNIYNGICPTCNQKIEDTLLNSQNQVIIMTPEENIKHLNNQKLLFESIIKQKRVLIKDIEQQIEIISNSIKKLNQLAISIKSDLFKLKDEYNEHVILEKLNLERSIDTLNEVQGKFNVIKAKFLELSSEYKELLARMNNLNKDEYSDQDLNKIKSLKNKFVTNLKNFGYRSIEPEQNISISTNTLLPEIMGYDLKFDSSASDHIRGIWAYTIALQEVSLEYEGNHPKLLLFDEPNQHSIIEKDMRAFLSKIKSLNRNVQTIVGFTMKDEDSKKIIDELGLDDTIIKIDELAFKKRLSEEK